MMDEAVLRGMPVESAPLRLRRAPLPDEEDPGARAERVYREAAVAGFEEGVRQGRQDGSIAGYEDGLRSGREESQRLAADENERAVARETAALVEERAHLAAIACSWTAAFEQVSSLAEDHMVALCYEAICKIVGDAAVKPEGIRAALVEAMASERDEPRLLLRVHPADIPVLEQAGIAGAPGQSVAWRGDPEVAHGGCILESPSGGLDARLDTLLAGCKAALLMARDARSEPAAPARGDFHE